MTPCLMLPFAGLTLYPSWQRVATMLATLALCACSDVAAPVATGEAAVRVDRAPEGQCWSSVQHNAATFQLRRVTPVGEACDETPSIDAWAQTSLALVRNSPQALAAIADRALDALGTLGAPAEALPQQADQNDSHAAIRLLWNENGEVVQRAFSLAYVESMGGGTNLYRACTAARGMFGPAPQAEASRDRFAEVPLNSAGVRVELATPAAREPIDITRSAVRYHEGYWSRQDGLSDLAFDQVEFSFRSTASVGSSQPDVCTQAPGLGAAIQVVGYNVNGDRMVANVQLAETLLYPIAPGKHVQVHTLLGADGWPAVYEGLQGGAVADASGCLVGTVSQILQASSGRVVFYAVGQVSPDDESEYWPDEVEQGWVRQVFFPLIGR